MRTRLRGLVIVAGFLGALAWTPAAPAQYVRISAGIFSTPGFTSMTLQPLITPSTAARSWRGGGDQGDGGGRNDAEAVGWGKNGFSRGRSYRRPVDSHVELAPRGTVYLRGRDRRDLDARLSRDAKPRPR